MQKEIKLSLSDIDKEEVQQKLNNCVCKDDTEPCTCCAVLQYEIKTK